MTSQPANTTAANNQQNTQASPVNNQVIPVPTGAVTGIPGQPASWAGNNPYLKPFWYTPQRVARYYHVINNLPPNVQPDPDVVDAPAIKAAYQYFQNRNPGKSWMDWEELPDGDPGQAMLQAIPTPGTALLWPDEQQYAQAQQQAYTPPAPEQIGDPAKMGLTDAQYDALPTWQKWMISILSSPITTGVMGAIPGIAIGAAAGGPVGALVGGVAGAGTALYAQQNPDSAVGKALNMLDVPRQALEIGIGDFTQIYNSLVDPAKYGTLDELLKNMDAVNAASRLGYEVTPVLDVANLMAATENLLRGKGFVGAGAGQAWQIGNPDPVQVFDPKKDTSDLLVQFRREVMAGASPEEVFQKYSQELGLSGMGREFVSGILLDPLNALPGMESLVGGKIARAAGNTRLAAAFETTEGLMNAVQKYGTILRNSNFDTLKNLNPLERMLAGVTADGVPTWMVKPTEQNPWQKWGAYLTGLTPSAQASQVLDNGIVTLGTLLGQASTPEEMIRLLKGVANTPAELARELSINALNSPNGAALPLMLRDYKPETQLAIWEGTRWSRDLLNNVAEITGRTPEQVLADYNKGGLDFEVTLRQLVEKARQSDAPEAKWIVEAFDNGELTGVKLGEMVRGFAKDGLPYSADMFRAQLFKDVLTQGQKWAVDWFGVKPAGQIVRLAQTVKSAQSLVLLGMNPTYLVNNAINNIVTMAYSGVFGMRNLKEVDALWERIGVRPTRLKAGVGVGALGLDDWSVLREASTQAGKLSDVNRVISEKLGKLQVFSNLSNRVESWSSAQAMTSGFLQAWGRMWKRGSGFDALPAELERTLRAMDPNLPRFIYDAIENGLNKAEVERALWTATSRRSVNSYLADVAGELKMSVDDVTEGLRKTGVYDVLDQAIAADPTPDGVRAAFEKVNTQIEDYFDGMHSQEIDAAVERAKARSQTEGMQAALDIYDGDQIDWMSNYMTGSADWDALFEDTLNMTEGQRSAYVRRQFAIEQRRWQRYYKRAQAALVGIAKGLGLDNATGRNLVELGDELARMWQDFHAEKRRLQAEYWATDFGDDVARKNLAWNELNTKLDELFRDAGMREQGINGRMTDIFASYAEAQYGKGAGDAARAWRKQTQDFRDQHVIELRAQFQRIKKMSRADRLAAWQEFQRGMMPQVLDQVRANLRGAHDLFMAATGQERPINGEPGLLDLEVATRGGGADLGAAPDGPVGPDVPPRPAESAGPAEPVRTTAEQTATPSGPVGPSRDVVTPVPTETVVKLNASGDGWIEGWMDIPDREVLAGASAPDQFKALYAHEAYRPYALEKLMLVDDATFREVATNLDAADFRKVKAMRNQVKALLDGRTAELSPEMNEALSQALAAMSVELDGAPDWYGRLAGLKVYDDNGVALGKAGGLQVAIAQLGREGGFAGKRMLAHKLLLELAFERVRKSEFWGKFVGRDWDFRQVDRELIRLDKIWKETLDITAEWERYIELLGQAGEYHPDGLPPLVQDYFTMYENKLVALEAEQNGIAPAPRAAAVPEPAAVADVNPTPLPDLLVAAMNDAVNAAEDAAVRAAEERAAAPRLPADETLVERIARLEADGQDAGIWQKRQAAQAYGLGVDLLAEDWRSMARTLDRAIVQDVNRYMGTRYARLGEISVDEILRAYVQRIFELEDVERRWAESQKETPSLTPERREVKRSETVVPLDSDAAALQQQARLERTLGQYEATMHDLNAPAVDKRAELRNGLVKVYRLSEVEADAVMQVTDARARTWARANNSTPAEWYATHIDQVREGTIGDIGVAQIETGVKGGVRFDEGRAVLLAFDSPDVSTAVHEIGHIFRRDLDAAGMQAVADWLNETYGVDVGLKDGEFRGPSRGLMVDGDGVPQAMGDETRWVTYTDVQQWAEERFARAFERYLADGHAPTTGLQAVFNQFKTWLLDIYHSLTGSGIDVPLSDAMRGLFDRLLSEDESGPRATPWTATDEGPKRILLQAADEAPGGGRLLPKGLMADYAWMAKHGQLGDWSEAEQVTRLAKRFGVEEDEIVMLFQVIDQAQAANKNSLIEARTALSQSGVEGVRGVPGDGVPVQDVAGRIRWQELDGEPQALSVGQPLGTVDSAETTPPTARIMEEGYRQQVAPVLESLKRKMLDPTQNAERGLNGRELDPMSRRAMQQWLHQVYGQMADTKVAAVKWAENRRDAALLNYSARTGFDELAGVVFPYSFWYTRSAVQWALRAMDRPAYLANWVRLRAMQDRAADSPGFPTRLRGKMKIPVPFLPKWAGDGIYIDPMKQLFPIENLFAPFEKALEQDAQNVRTAEYNLQAAVQNEEISAEAATEAIRTHKGEIWDRAMTQARMETEQNIGNPFDFLSLISGPSLPIQWLYQGLIKGTPEKIGSLPITRQFRAATALMGANQGRGYNLEGPIRRALGMPEVDEFTDYRVDRMLANMAAEGYPVEDIMRAMIDRSGPLFVEAEARAAKVQAVTTLGSPLGADLFPEGEREQRALKLEFDKAIAAKAAGDSQALTKFMDAYPQYEARMAQMKSDPEERLRTFLIGKIWDGYMGQSDLYQKQYREQLGELFDQRFMNKETRNYSAIGTATLAAWAQALGQKLPESAGPAAEISLDMASPEVSAAYQTYRDEAKRLFPQINSILNVYYQLKDADKRAFEARYPQIEAYDRWKNAYFAEHPEVIPYAIGDQNKVAKASPEIQALYYQYQAAIDSRYGDIYGLQDAYFAAPNRKAFLAQHPELSEYWNFREEFMKTYPQVIPYLYSVEGLKNKIFGADSGGSYGGGNSSNSYSANGGGGYTSQASSSLSNSELRQFSPALVRQLYAFYLANQELGEGAQRELRRLFDASGREGRGQSFETYVDTVVRASFR